MKTGDSLGCLSYDLVKYPIVTLDVCQNWNTLSPCCTVTRYMKYSGVSRIFLYEIYTGMARRIVLAVAQRVSYTLARHLRVIYRPPLLRVLSEADAA